MSGIIDSKSRVLDTIVTLEGRRQIAQGKLRIAHVSFTDGAAFYAADIASGSADASQRVYLEAADLPHDQIVFESDDSGRLTPFRSANGLQVRAGQLIKYEIDSDSSGAFELVQLLSSSESIAGSSTLLDSSISSFQNQLLLGNRDPLFEDDGFGAGPSQLTFMLNDAGPIVRADAQTARLENLDSLFQDVRLSGLPNFRFLPPVNARPAGSDDDSQRTSSQLLGNYRPAGRASSLTYPELERELRVIARAGGRQTITFDPTTKLNRLVGQAFERLPAGLRKLDIIDFGTFRTGDASAPTAHAFFAGRLLKDSRGTDVFVHLFTFVFE